MGVIILVLKYPTVYYIKLDIKPLSRVYVRLSVKVTFNILWFSAKLL